MSREDYINLNSYANIIISSNLFFKIKYRWNPSVRSVSTASTGFCLILVLMSSPLKVGGTVTTTSLTLLLDGCGNPTWSQVGPIGHVISVMANWPPWVFYGIHTITPSNGHILPSLAFLANSHFTNPKAFIFGFGTGGHFVF
ncbi:hypothetical protein O181_084298 [Austropuccinia psidii MF-1]|uniref:Uncharacterized protein n=1 Tax=Austropuccinia psidii MF-1 TaxID=1389203 RepID=A0A9Q3IKI0_9BASI|nr:hypothetical protein [Austropuccinia psidii MF-1]